MNTPNISDDFLAWLSATAVAVVAWLGKTWRADSKESRDLLLTMQQENNQAMHAMAAALDRNTERDNRNEAKLAAIQADLGALKASLQRSSGPQ